MQQREQLQSIAQELMTKCITEGIVAIGKDIMPIGQCIESVAE